MMQVKEEQLRQMWKLDRLNFTYNLTQQIISAHPRLTKNLPAEVIHQIVDYCIDRATIANKFTLDIDIETFVELMFSIGPDFDQQPEIHSILNDNSLSPEKRWTILTEDPRYAEAWNEADALDSQDNWFIESEFSIEKAYPTTHRLPGFIALYNKWSKENSFLHFEPL